MVTVFREHEAVASHVRLTGKCLRDTVADHMPPEAQAWLMQDTQCCLKCAEQMAQPAMQTQLLSSLRAAQATGNYARRFQSLVKVPLLIIDDFGLKPLRSPEDEEFHDLIAERYERAATILTSNLDFDEWGKHLPLQKQQKSRILYPQFEPLK